MYRSVFWFIATVICCEFAVDLLWSFKIPKTCVSLHQFFLFFVDLKSAISASSSIGNSIFILYIRICVSKDDCKEGNFFGCNDCSFTAIRFLPMWFHQIILLVSKISLFSDIKRIFFFAHRNIDLKIGTKIFLNEFMMPNKKVHLSTLNWWKLFRRIVYTDPQCLSDHFICFIIFLKRWSIICTEF